MLDFNEIKSVHFIGVGGVSMSSLALLMRRLGKAVTGSDKRFSEKLNELTEAGCTVWVGDEVCLIKKPDVVVYSSAVPLNDEELVFCQSKGIPCLERFIFWGEVARLFKYTVAISGTHGKTSVTAMIINVLNGAGAAFYGHLGGDAVDFGGFLHTGYDYMVTEACEFRKSLLAIRPDIAVILNAEHDHPDTYATLSEVFDTFDTFLENVNPRGLKIVNYDTDYYNLRQKNSDCITFGESGQGFTAENITEYSNGQFRFSISHLGVHIDDICLKVYGKHNVMNALAAYAVCNFLGVEKSLIKSGLENYNGVKRRFEYKGYFMGARVFCDYAHHPAEILSALKTAQSLRQKNGKIITVFQPHTFSRTALLMDAFSSSLKNSDTLLIVKEYSAREDISKGKSAKALFDNTVHNDKHFSENLISAACFLTENVSADDTIVILGAGDIDVLCDILLSDQT